MRKSKLHVEKKYCIKLPPQHFLHAWSCKRSAWLINCFQPKKNGIVAHRSMRGRNNAGELAEFGENVMFEAVTGDKYEERWQKGVFVGKVDQTDESILLTPYGVTNAWPEEA